MSTSIFSWYKLKQMSFATVHQHALFFSPVMFLPLPFLENNLLFLGLSPLFCFFLFMFIFIWFVKLFYYSVRLSAFLKFTIFVLCCKMHSILFILFSYYFVQFASKLIISHLNCRLPNGYLAKIITRTADLLHNRKAINLAINSTCDIFQTEKAKWLLSVGLAINLSSV